MCPRGLMSNICLRFFGLMSALHYKTPGWGFLKALLKSDRNLFWRLLLMVSGDGYNLREWTVTFRSRLRRQEMGESFFDEVCLLTSDDNLIHFSFFRPRQRRNLLFAMLHLCANKNCVLRTILDNLPGCSRESSKGDGHCQCLKMVTVLSFCWGFCCKPPYFLLV